MDIVDICKYMYKKLEEREKDLSSALSHGSVQNWDQYK